MFLLKLFETFFILLIVLGQEDSPEGIDVGDGDAEVFYNKTYSEDQSALEKAIFSNYRRDVRPVEDKTRTTNIDVHFHITHISIDQAQQTMTINGHLFMSWIDKFLGWNPDDYNGIKHMVTNKWKVWHPKLRVSNSVSGVMSTFDFARQTHVVLQTVGKGAGAKVEMYPTFSIKASCNFDYSRYPNDENECSLSIYTETNIGETLLRPYKDWSPTLKLAWDHNDEKLMFSDFAVRNITNQVIYFSNNTLSTVEPQGAKQRKSSWSVVRCTISFSRQHAAAFISLYLPCLICAIINILSYFVIALPNAALLLVANITVQAVFLQDCLIQLPPSTTSIPFSIKLFALIAILNCISLLQHVILAHLQKSATSPPEWLMNSDSDPLLPKDSQTDLSSSDWTEAINRLRRWSLYTVCGIYLIWFIVYWIY